MKTPLALCFSLVSILFLVTPVFAERGSGGRGLAGAAAIRNANDERWDDGFLINQQPNVIVVEDPKAAEERRKEQERRDVEARQKALRAHGDPGGGFFNENQSPKDMFSK